MARTNHMADEDMNLQEGDKVRVVNPEGKHHYEKEYYAIGDTGIVNLVTNDGYWVNFDESSTVMDSEGDREWFVNFDWLERVK